MDFAHSAEATELHTRMTLAGVAAQEVPAGERLDHLAKHGVLGLAIATKHGGGGYNLVATAHAFEALGASLDDGGVLLAAGAHLFGVALAIQKMGSDEQKERWLPPLARGEVIATVAATEEGAGSDIASVASFVEEDGDALALTGDKRFVTSAGRAGLFLVIARDRTHGVTALLVSGSSRGITRHPPLATAGLRGAQLAPVSFNRTPVARDGVLGRHGSGLGVFQVAMTYERALILAFRLGAMERQLDRAIAYARKRSVGVGPIGRHQAIAHRIARMKLRLDTSRLLTYRACWVLDRERRANADAALAKWHVAESAIESAIDALQVRGGAGFLEESGAPAGVLDALGGSIHSGTSDVLATIVARMLGL